MFVGAVVRYEFHLDALYGQCCHMPAPRLARAKAYAWLEVIVLDALLGQRLYGGGRRIQELTNDYVKLVERKVHLPIGGGDSDVFRVSVRGDPVVAWALQISDCVITWDDVTINAS